MHTKKNLQKVLSIVLFFTIATLLSATKTGAQEILLRFPDIHEDLIVFSYGEDLWTASVQGGIATRITSDDGEERFPKFSPDGSLIAFSGYYDGNGDVYVMNRYGGNITRITFHPSYDEVIGWHPGKNKILFKSFRGDYPGFTQLFLINPDGSGLESLILHEAAQGSFSPDGSQIAFNKVSRENRTWKRYKGGTAQEIYLYDLNTHEEKNLTNFEGTDRIPMWIGDKIYFSSDRDRRLNIYSVDPVTAQIEKITNHSDYDVRRPSYGGDKIIYELGGELYVLDVNTRETTRIPVLVKTDLPEVRPYLKNVKENITDIDLSPAGERALITARGEIFSVPAEKGQTINLTGSSGAHDKDAVWSPDGKHIAYISDADGEYNIYITDHKGTEKPRKLTDKKDGYRHTLRWSPDSKKLAYTDQTLTCYIVDIDSGKEITVDKAEYENIDVSLDVKPIYDFSWSPDSRYLVYSKMDADMVFKVYIYSLEENISRCISTIFNDFHPVFSRNGKYLFFVSNRRFNPTFCDFEWEMVYKKTSGIYYITLQKGTESLFPHENNEVNVETSAESEGTVEETKISIDWNGIEERIEALPLERGNYRYLSVNESSIFYLNKEEGDFNRFEYRVPESMDLYRFSFEEKEEKKVIEGIGNYKLSADGKKIIYTKNKKAGIIDAAAVESQGNDLNLNDLKMWLIPKQEWVQIFNEAWRMERDFYYEPNMHGIDWDAMKVKYGRLIAAASCRQDVQFVIGEMIGELNTSHTYVYGGDRKRTPEQVSTGMLGADYSIDEENNRYRFERILDVGDWSRDIFPPLMKPGVDIRKGDYLLKVNEVEVTADKNIYSYFRDLAGKLVVLTVNESPDMEGAREYLVKPASNEYLMRYQAWVEDNRKTVDEASDGQIGYMHLPDTYVGSATEFPKYFYSQSNKKGLIIDGRFNGGGLDPVIFLSRLQKEPHSFWTRRYSHDQTSPHYSITAHMVCLTNRQAGSGGDELPQEFQQFGMGPVIGTRTWGGLVGVSMFIPLIDGGGLTAPDYRIYSPEGKWIVENEGVTPDIIIDLKPEEVARGYDAQLMKGVEVLLKKIEDEPYEWPEHPPFPADK